MQEQPAHTPGDALLQRFVAFAKRRKWLGERVLLAVSGGLDSVALAALCKWADWDFGLAHCNFQLRGDASDGDADFARALAAEYAAPFYEKRFDTRALAAERGWSLQMAARQLRYDWLEAVRRREGYRYVATAHHLNDSLETLLLNFTKGCGLRGLQGIPAQNGAVIRPLLFATRAELAAFVAEEELSFREDASNEEDKYERNYLRHHVIPRLREINPALEQTIAGNLAYLKDALRLYEEATEQYRRRWVAEDGDRLTVNYSALQRHPARGALLYEWLSGFGFTGGQISALSEEPAPQVGAVFYAPDHRLLVDREELVVEPLENQGETRAYLMTEDAEILELPDGALEIERHAGRPVAFGEDNNVALVDARAPYFPLTVRHWRSGDRFQPLGMGGQGQKLQDFFSNQKIDRFEKGRIWLVVDARGRIVWVVGRRLDERFRIRPETDGYFTLRFQKK